MINSGLNYCVPHWSNGKTPIRAKINVSKIGEFKKITNFTLFKMSKLNKIAQTGITRIMFEVRDGQINDKAGWSHRVRR